MNDNQVLLNIKSWPKSSLFGDTNIQKKVAYKRSKQTGKQMTPIGKSSPSPSNSTTIHGASIGLPKGKPIIDPGYKHISIRSQSKKASAKSTRIQKP